MMKKWLRSLLAGLYILLGLGFVYTGVETAQTFWRVATPSSQFIKASGQVVEVVKHRNSDPDMGPPYMAEVRFSYGWKGRRFVSNTLSPNCRWCTPQEVVDAVGVRPSRLAAGTPVSVFVHSDSPGVAYIRLSTMSDVWDQLALTLLSLVIAPLFIYWHYGMWWRTEAEPSPSQ